MRKKESQERLREYYCKEIEWIRDEYNRVCPEEYWAYMSSPGELYVMNRDTLSNATHYLHLLPEKGYKGIGIWEYSDSDFSSPSSPVAVYGITQMNELMIGIIKLMGFKPSFPLNIRYKAEVVSLVADFAGETMDNVLKSVSKSRVNMNLYDDVQRVKKGELSVSLSSLAKKYKISLPTVIGYKKRAVKCRGCGKVSIFNSKLYKEGIEKYGSEAKFKEKYRCKK